MSAKPPSPANPMVLEFGMGVDVHGLDGTKAACRAVSDAIRHSSLPMFQEVRERGGKMLVDVTVGVPEPASVDVERVRRELPHGEVSVKAVSGGLRVPGSDTLIACAAITVSVEYPR
ncbi:MAG: Lin0512 family protein [Candidatus Rokuibacteriota bacterium]